MLLLLLVVFNMHEILCISWKWKWQLPIVVCLQTHGWMESVLSLTIYITPKFHRIANCEKRLPLRTNLLSRGILIMWLEQCLQGLQTVITLKYLSNKYDGIGSVPCYLTIWLSSLPNQLSLVEVDFSLLTLELPLQSKSRSQVPLSILALSLKSKRWSSVFIYGTV